MGIINYLFGNENENQAPVSGAQEPAVAAQPVQQIQMPDISGMSPSEQAFMKYMVESSNRYRDNAINLHRQLSERDNKAYEDMKPTWKDALVNFGQDVAGAYIASAGNRNAVPFYTPDTSQAAQSYYRTLEGQRNEDARKREGSLRRLAEDRQNKMALLGLDKEANQSNQQAMQFGLESSRRREDIARDEAYKKQQLAMEGARLSDSRQQHKEMYDLKKQEILQQYEVQRLKAKAAGDDQAQKFALDIANFKIKVADHVEGSPDVKDFILKRGFFETIEQNLKDSHDSNRPINDVQLVYAMMKILDPTSVVRENEVGMTSGAASIFEKLGVNVMKILSGESLSNENRKAIYDLATRELSSAQSRAAPKIESIMSIAKGVGVNAKDVFNYKVDVPMQPFTFKTTTNTLDSTMKELKDYTKQGLGFAPSAPAAPAYTHPPTNTAAPAAPKPNPFQVYSDKLQGILGGNK